MYIYHLPIKFNPVVVYLYVIVTEIIYSRKSLSLYKTVILHLN